MNSKEPGWKLWEQADGYPSRGLKAFRAAEAARRQGHAAFEAFHMALLRARHEQKTNISDPVILLAVASAARLDVSRFEKDLSNPAALQRLAADHTFAVDKLGAFGTPTLVFPEEQAVYVKMAVPPDEECSALFDEVSGMIMGRRYVQELKRPRRP